MNPELLACRRVERDQRIVATSREQHVVDHNRIEPRPGVRIGPGDLELVDVGFPDLVHPGERGTVRPSEIVEPPFVTSRRSRAGSDRHGDEAGGQPGKEKTARNMLGHGIILWDLRLGS